MATPVWCAARSLDECSARRRRVSDRIDRHGHGNDDQRQEPRVQQHEDREGERRVPYTRALELERQPPEHERPRDERRGKETDDAASSRVGRDHLQQASAGGRREHTDAERTETERRRKWQGRRAWQPVERRGIVRVADDGHQRREDQPDGQQLEKVAVRVWSRRRAAAARRPASTKPIAALRGIAPPSTAPSVSTHHPTPPPSQTAPASCKATSRASVPAPVTTEAQSRANRRRNGTWRPMASQRHRPERSTSSVVVGADGAELRDGDDGCGDGRQLPHQREAPNEEDDRSRAFCESLKAWSAQSCGRAGHFTAVAHLQ